MKKYTAIQMTSMDSTRLKRRTKSCPVLPTNDSSDEEYSQNMAHSLHDGNPGKIMSYEELVGTFEYPNDIELADGTATRTVFNDGQELTGLPTLSFDPPDQCYTMYRSYSYALLYVTGNFIERAEGSVSLQSILIRNYDVNSSTVSVYEMQNIYGIQYDLPRANYVRSVALHQNIILCSWNTPKPLPQDKRPVKKKEVVANAYDQSETDLSRCLFDNSKSLPKHNRLQMTPAQQGQSESIARNHTEESKASNTKTFCSTIKALSRNIIHVWEGYAPEEQDYNGQNLCRIFVAVVKRKIVNLKEKILSFLPVKEFFRVIQRLPDEVSDEAKKCLEKEANIAFSLEEHNLIRDTLLRNSGDLMKTHGNLQVVSASKIKSKQNGRTVKMGPCIVMYVHVKGIIPVNEEPFPHKVGDFLVDVREGVFTNYGDPKLAIGCTISGKGKTGKIAGFVHLPNGNIGCLTCAHVFNIHENMEVDGKDVYQLSPNESNTPFGKVDKWIYDKGYTKNETEYKIGVDAALIEITDKVRYPKDGNYRHSVPPLVECTSTLDYYSGKILTSPDAVAKMCVDKNTKCKIVRYNENKQKMYVRTGRVNMDGTAVRAWYPTSPSEPCQLYTQIHIHPDPNEVVDVEDQSFATLGDSGSLVFLVSDDGENMWAFGMVVGGLKADGSAIVTPIWAVLDAFGLPRKFMSFKYLGSQLNELSAKVDNMDVKVNHIGGIMNQIGQAMTQMDGQMCQMDQKMNLMDGTINQIGQKMNQMDGAMGQMDQKMNQMDDNIKTILSYITGKDNKANTDQHSSATPGNKNC